MKTLRFIGVALLTVLMSVGFSACGGSDDDVDNGGGGSSASFEGEWHTKTLIEYEWDSSKNVPDLSKVKSEKTFGRTKDFETWAITKSGNDKILIKFMSDNDAKYHYDGSRIRTWETEYKHMSGNEYYIEKNGKVTERLIFKNISSDQLTIEYVEYYSSGTGYGIYTLVR